MRKKVFSLLALLVCLSPALGLQKSTQEEAKSQLLRKDRPSVYLEFDRIGKAPPLFDGENEERIWLKLHNNSKWTIEFCSFPVKSQYGGTGIVYAVKHQQPTLVSVGVEGSSSRTTTLPGDKDQRENAKAPQGYSTGDTCTAYYLGSGKSVVFSLPRDHLRKNLYLEIEFWPEWENRDNELGSFPQSYVSFSNHELPINER
jgi:hypothetical protein